MPIYNLWFSTMRVKDCGIPSQKHLYNNFWNASLVISILHMLKFRTKIKAQTLKKLHTNQCKNASIFAHTVMRTTILGTLCMMLLLPQTENNEGKLYYALASHNNYFYFISFDIFSG